MAVDKSVWIKACFGYSHWNRCLLKYHTSRCSSLFKIVTIFWYQLNKNAYGTSLQTIKQWKYCWYLDFFIILGLLIVKICFIIILKEKMTRFWLLILFFSLNLKKAPPSFILKLLLIGFLYNRSINIIYFITLPGFFEIMVDTLSCLLSSRTKSPAHHQTKLSSMENDCMHLRYHSNT